MFTTYHTENDENTIRLVSDSGNIIFESETKAEFNDQIELLIKDFAEHLMSLKQ